MTPEQRIEQLERKLAALEEVMEVKQNRVFFKKGIVVPGKMQIDGSIFFGDVQILTGTGAPSLSAHNGSMYLRDDAPANEGVYFRENGSWAAKT